MSLFCLSQTLWLCSSHRKECRGRSYKCGTRIQWKIPLHTHIPFVWDWLHIFYRQLAVAGSACHTGGEERAGERQGRWIYSHSWERWEGKANKTTTKTNETLKVHMYPLRYKKVQVIQVKDKTVRKRDRIIWQHGDLTDWADTCRWLENLLWLLYDCAKFVLV